MSASGWAGDRWRRVQELFELARGVPEAEREELLGRECGDDGELRDEVESLLRAGDEPGAVDSLVEWLAPLRARVLGNEMPRELGPYRPLAELGRGGMGVVYRAHDPRLGREVAVKVLHSDLAADDEIAGRFIAEARAASALDHPHVCTVHDLGRLDDGRLYLAMAFYPGGSLADRLAGGPLPVAEAVRVASQIAAGLHRAHEAGIVHRDVKPANVAFSGEGDAKILDFGVAKLAAATGVTRPGMVLGTPRYMAPEAVRGDAFDRRADVWALAAVTYEMLAGRPAFDAGDAVALWRKVLETEPEPLERLRAEVPPAVCEAVARGLSKDPARRPPTARAFAELLRRGEAGTGATGQPSTAGASPERSWSGAAATPVPPLPVPLTSFVGRERELEELTALLGRARLVTLTGAGGTGKTRLAIETARRLADSGAAVRLVALADLRDARLVPATVARALGVEGGREPLEAIAAAVGGDRLLLVLDNLEHLPEAATWIAELLGRCPGVTVLATSRGPLRLTAEQERPVPPLTEAARRLFLERARAASPDLEIGPEEEVAADEICRRLDGLPLAVELAAARVRLFPPRQLAEQLRRRLDLPGAGPRDQPDRHRTLRAAVAWSYDLLASDHRRLFRSLSVFRGGFTIEQASRLVGLEPPELADGLDALLDQALLLRPSSGRGASRFRLLETLRVFAAEELESGGEAAEVRRAHRRLFLELAEEAAPQLEAGDQREWFARLDRDHDNLRAALDGAERDGDAEAGLRLATALWRYWLARGHVAEGLERLEELLAAARGCDPAMRLRALLGAATLAHNTGGNARARRLLETARALAVEHGDDRARLQLANNLAWVACEMGDLAAAERLSEEGLELARALGDARGEAVALNNLGFLAAYHERWDDSARLHRESLALRRAVGDARGEGFALINLSWAEREAGRLAEAERRLEEGFERVRPLGDRIFLAWARLHRACLQAARGEVEAAFGALGELAEETHRAGNLSQVGEVFLARGRLARRLRRPEARGLLERALDAWLTCGARLYVASTQLELGAVAAAEGEAAEAGRLWREALETAEQIGAIPLADRARAALAGRPL